MPVTAWERFSHGPCLPALRAHYYTPSPPPSSPCKTRLFSRIRPEVSGIGDFSSKCPRNPLKQKLSQRGAAGSSEVEWGRCPAKQQMRTKNIHLSSSPLGGISLPSTARLRMLQQTRTRVLNKRRTDQAPPAILSYSRSRTASSLARITGPDAGPKEGKKGAG